MNNCFIIAILFCFSSLCEGEATNLAKTNNHSKGNPTEKFEKIYITAEKIKSDKNYSSSSIIIINKKDIANFRSKNIVDLLSNYAGVDFSSSGSETSASSVYLRGSDSRHTKVIVDGFDYQNSASIGGNERLEMINIDSVEKIEILKGSQGVLYGSDAIGGVIKITTNKNEQFININASSLNRKQATGSLITKKKNWKLIGNASIVDGKQFSALAKGSEKDGFNKLNLSLDLNRKTTESESNILVKSINSETNYDEITGNELSLETYKKNLFGLNHKSRYYEGKLENLSTIVIQDSDTLYQSISSGDSRYRGKSFKLLSENTFYIDRNRKVLFGIDYFKEQASIFSTTLNSAVSQQNIDIYGDYSYHGKPFFSSLGIRASKYESKDLELSSKASLGKKYNLLILKTSINTGYKMPSLYQLKGKYGNLKLKPERSISIDLSFEFNFKKENIEVSIFDLYYKNFINQTTSTSLYQNINNVRSRGLEVNATIERWHKFSFVYSFHYIKSIDLISKKQLKNRAIIKDTLYLNYKHNQDLLVGLGLIYKSKRRQFDETYLPSYQLLNLKIDYRLTTTSVIYMKIENFLNKKYQEVKNYSTAGVNLKLGFNQKF